MTTEAEHFLRKSHESLASAESDLAAIRFNSTANRSYYAAFQAAVAALSAESIRPEGAAGWEHRFVMSHFPGRLIRARKIYPGGLRNTLNVLFESRLTADYRVTSVSRKGATGSIALARRMLELITTRLNRLSVGEGQVEYHDGVMETRTPESLVDEVRSTITGAFPDSNVDVVQRGPRDFTLEVYNVDEIMDVQDVLAGVTSDILVDHDVWIVVLALGRRDDLN
jgi:uncharacterized protein (UPF0332 family)